MNVSLTDDLGEFVAQQLREGGYNNQSEVVREGLCLLRMRNGKLARLRAEIDLAIAETDAGKTKPLTDELLRDIAEQGRRLAATRKARRP